MLPSDTNKAADMMLKREAVRFKSNLMYSSEKAWPFWYNLIPYPYLTTDKLNGGMGLLGQAIPTGSSRDFAIKLDRDTAFRLINFKYSAYRPGFGEQLTGTITATAGSATITGVLTLFTTELSVGQTIIWIADDFSTRYGVIKRIDSALSLELESPAIAAATAVNLFMIAWKHYDTVQNINLGQNTALTGTLTINAAGTVTGVGSDFVNELSVGDTLIANDALGTQRHFVVNGVTLATAATVDPIAGITVPAGSTGYKSEWSPTLTGSVTIAALGVAVVGVGTDFVNELAVGSVFGVTDAAGVYRYFMVATIVDATNLTITETLGAIGVAGARMTKFADGGLTGTLTLLDASTRTVQGNLTAFDTEISAGDAIWFVDASGVVVPERAIIDHVNSATLMKFNNPVSVDGPVGTSIGIGVHTVNAGVVPYNRNRYRDLSLYIKSTVSLPSLHGRYLYGGVEEYMGQGAAERPRPVPTLQGVDSGVGGRLRTPALLPFDGVINFKIHNTYSETVLINAQAFGYKIALEEE